MIKLPPIGLFAGDVLTLHIKAKQSELERLESETGMSVVAVEDGRTTPMWA